MQTKMTPMNDARPITRLAPSPTGALHLGNARTFLINWAMARQQGWEIVLRMEDLDGPRVKPGAAEGALAVLAWLGMDWDYGPYDQLADLTPYRAALEALHAKGLVYPCTLTRSEIAAARSAPHGDDEASGSELRYPGVSRGADAGDGSDLLEEDEQAWRVTIPEGRVAFEDALAGPQAFDVQAEVGDFIVATKAGLPAYQLAVVVDDHRQGVTEVVRGDDLLSSAARQLWLYRLLEYRPEPTYTHVPLVLGPDGRRLAKRHGDTRVDTYRQRGVRAERVVGLLASWCGVADKRREMTAAEFAAGFGPDRLPREPTVFTAEDEAWLTQ